MSGRVAVVVAAGGAGRRMGGVRKQYLEIGGEPMLLHALRPFLAHPAVDWLIVALPEDDARTPPHWLADLDPRVAIVAGGEERADSVRLALAAVPPAADLVAVHDAARPLVTRAVIDRVLEAAASGSGAIAAIPAADTIKEVDATGRVTGTPDRRRLWRAQTPQAFPRRLLIEAYEAAHEARLTAPDCAAIVEARGGRVRVVEGSAENVKVTGPADLAFAEAVLRERRSATGAPAAS